MGTVKKKKIKSKASHAVTTLKEDASSLYLFTEYTHFTQNYTSSSPTDYTQNREESKIRKKIHHATCSLAKMVCHNYDKTFINLN